MLGVSIVVDDVVQVARSINRLGVTLSYLQI